VSSSPAATVTLYVVDAASPLFGVNRYMLVLTHVPRPASVGVMTSGWGSASWSAALVRGTTGRLKATVIVPSAGTSAAPSTGWVLDTAR